MGAVKLTKSIEDIINEYHKMRFQTCKIADNEVSCNEEQCCQESSRKGYPCRLKKNQNANIFHVTQLAVPKLETFCKMSQQVQ